MNDRWRHIEELCHAVLARPREERTAFLARAMVSIRCRPVLAVVADWLRLGLRLRRRGRELAAPILFCLPLHCRCLRVLEL